MRLEIAPDALGWGRLQSLSRGCAVVEQCAKSSMGFLARAGRCKVEIGVSESGPETGKNWQENEGKRMGSVPSWFWPRFGRSGSTPSVVI